MRTPPPLAPPWLEALAALLPCLVLALVRHRPLPLLLVLTLAPMLAGVLVPPETPGVLVELPPVLPSPTASAPAPMDIARIAAPTAAPMPLRAFISSLPPFCLHEQWLLTVDRRRTPSPPPR